MGAAGAFDEPAYGSEPVASLSIESIAAMLKEKKNFLLSQDVEKYARFVSFGGGALKLNFNSGAPANLIKNLNQFFAEAKYRIKASKSDELGEDTIREKQEKLFQEQLASMAGNEILKETLRVFKDSYVAKIEPIK